MSLPLKDYRPGMNHNTHKILSRIARNRGISLEALGRQIHDEYAAKEVHDAKVVLGIDVDNADQLDFIGSATELHGTQRKGGRR